MGVIGLSFYLLTGIVIFIITQWKWIMARDELVEFANTRRVIIWFNCATKNEVYPKVRLAGPNQR